MIVRLERGFCAQHPRRLRVARRIVWLHRHHWRKERDPSGAQQWFSCVKCGMVFGEGR